MKAAKFLRQKGRIDGDRELSDSRRANLLRRLLADAGARRIFHHGTFIGYRLPDGEIVCKKHRYNSFATASDALGQMEEFTGKVPVRAYYCSNCKGFHLTSKPKDPTDSTLHM